MSDIKLNYKVSAKGVLSIDVDGRMTLSVEDEGDYNLAKVLEDFNGRSVKLSVMFDEDYGTEVDEDTGEVFE
jgi:hypothetical protein